MRKLTLFLLTVVVSALMIYFFFPDMLAFMTLENIKASHVKWVAIYQQKPFEIITYFFIFNTIAALLPVPGISMISLLGGSLFGFFPGFIISSFATALGNLGGFLLSRYFLQDWVRSYYGDHLRVFRDEWQSEGAFALFSFRLFPFIPSFVANYVMGVSALKWWTFFWVSWVGRIPMVVVYTWSGVQVAKIESLEDILSPNIVFSFIALGLMPWICKFAVKKFSMESR